MVGLLLESDDVMAKWESPQSLLDKRNLSPFWRHKFRKSHAQDPNLNRPDLRFG